MKIYQKTKFHQSGNVVVCVMTAKIKMSGLPFLEAKAVRGIARCAPEDEFNLEKGKMIAESKATQKLYNRITSSIKAALKETKKDIDFLNERLQKVADLKQVEEKHFEEILG